MPLLSPSLNHPSICQTISSLGVIFDRHDKHINNVYKACYFHIRALRHVRFSVSTDTANMVACSISSIVSTMLDYCNTFLADASEKNLDKLQLVQKTLVHVVIETH